MFAVNFYMFARYIELFFSYIDIIYRVHYYIQFFHSRFGDYGYVYWFIYHGALEANIIH